MRATVSLSPGKWIWYPSGRTLINTFVLFRREFSIDTLPESARGWIAADSRYELYINGTRVQWGPAPSDPTHEEADPMDLLPYLQPGKNILSVKVLFYGIGDGTWVAGKPGLLYRVSLQYPERATELFSDEKTICAVDYGHRPGQFQRWYLRALQEEFDARRAELNWAEPDFTAGPHWKPAMVVGTEGDRPSVYNQYYEYTSGGLQPQSDDGMLYTRELPMPLETEIPVQGLVETGKIRWHISPDDWFLFRSPDCFAGRYEDGFYQREGDEYAFRAPVGESCFFTFDFKEQVVGFPYFTIAAPEGTVVELVVQESHRPHGAALLLDTAHHCWARFICRDGKNSFRCFDFESVKWLQLHITSPAGSQIRISDVGVLRRKYPFETGADITVPDPALQRMFNAGVNTLYNAAIETLVDGMGRERQQYSGDASHALISLRSLLGNTLISKRFIQTFSDGMTSSGYFLDCYPAIDRLKRIPYKQIGLSYWGPIIDHSVGFVCDCHKYGYETGDFDTIRDVYPKLKRFVDYLIRQSDGDLFPVEANPEYCVWLDHHAFSHQRHRLGCMNLYICAMLRHHWLPLMGLLGETDTARYAEYADRLHRLVVEQFWDAEQKMFWDNLPWQEEEGGLVVSDRTLATAVLYQLCPDGDRAQCADYLAYCPDIKLSYPCNAVWRQWALANTGHADVVLKDLRTKWAVMPSVIYNNAYQEHWIARTDSVDEWSHIPQAPMIAIPDVLVGIRPTSPAYRTFELSPQLADIGEFRVSITTVSGTVRFQALPLAGRTYRVRVEYPACMEGWLNPRDRMRIEGLELYGACEDETLYELPSGIEFKICYEKETAL